MTASPEVLCSQVHAVHPLLCRDVQLFHFWPHSDGNTSAEERMTADRDTKKRDIEVRMTSVASIKHQARRRQKERQRNGQTLRQGEADRHRVKTVMSNWSDTGERGRQTEMSRETDRMECSERNLCETCHNKVSSAKQRERDDSARCIQECRKTERLHYEGQPSNLTRRRLESKLLVFTFHPNI